MKKPGNNLPLSEKAVLTPTEFAALFGRTYTWAYRQIYAGKVQVLTQLGRMMIPKSEVECLLAEKEVYNGRPPRSPKKSALPNVPSRQEGTSAG
jgi:predicted site-specific integrase-resolvase